MPEEKRKRMCPDPDCATESEVDVESCPKCGLDFGLFKSLGQVFDVRDKVARKVAEEKKPVVEKKRSTLENLAGRK